MGSEILKARIADTADICRKTGKPKFLGFLSKEESVLAERIMRNSDVKYNLFGGYDTAERVLLGCFPDWTESYQFPIRAVTFNFRKNDVLRHRDFLGGLIGLGLKREAVGDILVEEGRAVVFVSEDIADYIVNQVEKIGRTGVKVALDFVGDLPEKDRLSEYSVTVASERLDCVVAALVGISRSAASQKIFEGLVSVNSVACGKVTRAVAASDVVTVRGNGRFIIESLDSRTRKNRIVLKYKKYT